MLYSFKNIIIILILIAAIITLAIYNQLRHIPAEDVELYQFTIQKYLKKDIKLSYFKVKSINDSCFIAYKRRDTVIVYDYKKVYSSELKPDDFVSLNVDLIKENKVKAKQLHHHKGRVLKIYASLLPLILIFILILKYFKLNTSNLLLTSR
ncbi:MAG: hypothetical protein KA792_04575 [Bacteroidales bacterium]|nr:hypothetical protein [Bacteroidales bacterium]